MPDIIGHFKKPAVLVPDFAMVVPYIPKLKSVPAFTIQFVESEKFVKCFTVFSVNIEWRHQVPYIVNRRVKGNRYCPITKIFFLRYEVTGSVIMCSVVNAFSVLLHR